MSTATISRAQKKGLRHQFAGSFGKIRDFAIELYAAHGGWFAHDAGPLASVDIARTSQKNRREMLGLANDTESRSPTLSAELRNFATKN